MDNTISGNTANNNTYAGIMLEESHDNSITGNTLIGNSECIVEVDCLENEFKDNSCDYGEKPDIPIPGYNLFFLLGTLSILSIIIIISKKLKEKKHY